MLRAFVLTGLLAKPFHEGPWSERAESPQRVRILEIVRESPGLPVGRLLERTQIGWGTLHYHLTKLVKLGQVQIVRVGRRRLVYPAGGTRAEETAVGDALLRGKTARHIAEVIHARPGLSIQDIVDEVGQSARVVYYHVKRLIEAGLVTSSSDTRHRNLCPTQRLRALLVPDPAAPPGDRWP